MRFGLDDETYAAVMSQAARVSLPVGSVLYRPGDLCSQFLLLVSGSVRVVRVAESGREMMLYRVAAGETCVMTTACLLASEAYSASGVVETPVEALVLPGARFKALMESSPGLRALVFKGYGVRMLDLMHRIEELSDVPVSARLAAWLAGAGDAQGVVRATHQELATEIGTAREVVSRALERMEAQGLLRRGRGVVEILDPAGLKAVCD
jgi:CRP/FNR family transcriptional regulator